ncbi:transposase [Corynebacterium sp.]|uniref:transposase n=1 Tax=Corynebacterium sp. TaxID=1720 RepID=UPI0026DCFFF2|nr:transposase [Corynebacterium sp.]
MDFFHGRTAETTTLIPMINAYCQANRIDHLVVVADAAMLSAKNLDALDAAGIDYIVADRLRKAQPAAPRQGVRLLRLALNATGTTCVRCANKKKKLTLSPQEPKPPSRYASSVNKAANTSSTKPHSTVLKPNPVRMWVLLTTRISSARRCF